MAALTRAAFTVALLLAGEAAAQSMCVFENREISNPTAQGCGDFQLTYAATNPSNEPNVVPLGYPVPLPVASVAPVDGFRSYDHLVAGHQGMMIDHPGVVAGQIVGITLTGEDIWAYRIGAGGDTTVYGQAKGSVLINGGIHAREWQSPEVVTEVFERLVAGREDGGFVQYLIDNLAVYLIPVLNVDGFRQTQMFADRSTAHPLQPRDGRMRRKNLALPSGAGHVDGDLTTVEDNTHGVDLNRDHPVGFGVQPGNSMPRSLVHAGGAPHSEPETQALLAAADLADTDRLRLYIDVHSFTQIYFTPQTSSTVRNRNTELLADAMRAVTGNKYRYSPDPPGTDIGTTASYFAHTHQVPSWTLETEPLNGGQDYGGLATSHSGFVVPDAEIARIRDELARTLLLGFYRQAGPPAIAAAEIRDADGAVVWSVDFIPGAGGTRTLTSGAGGALEAGADYTLWVAFDKPMRWRAGGVVTQYAGQNVALAPIVALEWQRGNRIVREPVPASAADWLGQAGAAPNGYLNYRDDAFTVDFTVPKRIPAAATELTVTVETTDMTGFHLDAEPATVAAWSDGAWTGYEGADGPVETQATGPDRTTLRVPVVGGTGGGGGQAGWAVLAVLIALGGARRSARTRRRVPPPATSGR